MGSCLPPGEDSLGLVTMASVPLVPSVGGRALLPPHLAAQEPVYLPTCSPAHPSARGHGSSRIYTAHLSVVEMLALAFRRNPWKIPRLCRESGHHHVHNKQRAVVRGINHTFARDTHGVGATAPACQPGHGPRGSRGTPCDSVRRVAGAPATVQFRGLACGLLCPVL